MLLLSSVVLLGWISIEFVFFVFLCDKSIPILGGYCGGVPPLPIPNRAVKPACADGTAMQCGRVGDCPSFIIKSRVHALCGEILHRACLVVGSGRRYSNNRRNGHLVGWKAPNVHYAYFHRQLTGGYCDILPVPKICMVMVMREEERFYLLNQGHFIGLNYGE